MIELTLPYPVSANVYWRTAIVCGRAQTYPSAEAKVYKAKVSAVCRASGIRSPLPGRVSISVRLYPQQPKDWATRARKDPAGWDDDVRCIDLDNANKVVLDSLKNVAIEDDRWVRELHSRRMEPDGAARVVVRIAQVARPVMPQGELLGV